MARFLALLPNCHLRRGFIPCELHEQQGFWACSVGR